jgi:hypothetical protein
VHPADVRFHREILSRLNHEMDGTTTALVTGIGVADWPDYLNKLGYRRALVEAMSIASDIEDEMMGRKREELGEDRKFPD